MRHVTCGCATAGNHPGTEEKTRYAERRGTRQAHPNLAIDTTVRRREYFRFDACHPVGGTPDPSFPTHFSTCLFD